MHIDPSAVLADRDRLAHLARPHLLDSPREEAIDRLARLAARALRAPVALVTLVDDRRQFFKSSVGLAEPWATRRETPLSHSFCQYVVGSGETVVIEDARAMESLRESLAITDLGIVSYLGVPLLDATGMVLGSCAVADRVARAWTAGDVAALEDVASAVRTELGLLAETAERRRLEDQLRHAQKMEAVGRLAGGIAHDFNNLLTAILGNAELVIAELPPGEMRDELLDIRTAANRAAQLTRQLLAFSRKQVLRPRSIDLNAIVQESGQMLRRVIGEGVALSILPANDLWISRADPSQVEQVLANLVLNGRDAMPGGGSLIVETENRHISPEDVERLGGEVEPGDYAAIVVSDTGTGIDEDVRAHLFEPFFTTKEPGKGTGLGLSTVYGIARQSGGAVLVDSEPGGGSRFTVLFPRAEGPPDPQYATRAGGEPAAHGDEVVLVVEDEQAVRATIHRVLERRGYTVIEARHGGDAMLLLERGDPRPALVLADAVMPEMGGFELARRIAERWPRIPVLLMSGYSEKLLASKAGDLPARLVTKPFAADVLLRAVREILDGKPSAEPGS